MDLARMTLALASAQKVDYSLYISFCGNSSMLWTAYSVAQGNLSLTVKSPRHLNCPQAGRNLKLMRSSLQFVQFCQETKTKSHSVKPCHELQFSYLFITHSNEPSRIVICKNNNVNNLIMVQFLLHCKL